jgi:para-aminobenzoate synthetase component I
VLRDSFPGGSITGAPKVRAMQIIEALEPHRRGIYCGAIGYIGFDGNMDSNIAIRTAVCAKNRLIFYAGGGIVADSDVSKEYAETLDKASSLLTIIKLFTRL